MVHFMLCQSDFKKGEQASHKPFSAEKHHRRSMGVLGITFRREKPSGGRREEKEGGNTAVTLQLLKTRAI